MTTIEKNIKEIDNIPFSLDQGMKFKKYKDKKIQSLEKSIENVNSVEGFTSNLQLSANGLTNETKNVINSNNYSNDEKTLTDLKNEYQRTLNEYTDLNNKISSSTNSYFSRTKQSNPYLGKVIKLQSGELFYVTNQGVAKWFKTMDIYNEVSGKNGFPPKNQSVPVSIAWSDGYQYSGATIPLNPPLITGTPVKSSQSVGNEGKNVFVNEMISNPTDTYKGCYTDNSTQPLMTLIDASYNYQQCEKAAVTGGYKYFSLQNTNSTSSTGSCYVSNDGDKSISLGNSYVATNKINLWSSNTSGQTGNSAIFQNGSISVNNASDTSIFTTPNNIKQPSNYIGCYKDTKKRAMTMYNKGSQTYTKETCQKVAESIGATYYGLQNSTSGLNAQCFTSNDLNRSKIFGLAKNCTQIKDGSWSGGGWSNALYSTDTPESSYFLILQDDGNMCIYLGSSPDDKQGLIWSSETNGKQQQSNPNMVSTKNKFGKNWMPEGSILYPGEFLSSTNGNLTLIMQTDGSLVLYTYTNAINCQQMADGNTGGGIGANALYELSSVGIKDNMSKLAYIDEDSLLHTYPSTNSQYSNTYTVMTGTDSPGNDIGNSYSNANIEQCSATCNTDSSCAGFAFSNNTCYPKKSITYPNDKTQVNPNVNLYIRNKMPKTPPIGVSNSTTNIDTIAYKNYVDGGVLSKSYGLSNVTSIQKQQLDQLQTKLDLLSKQITNSTNKFDNGTSSAVNQSQKNIQGIQNYLNDINKTNNKIYKFDNNYKNILNDSDINVLKENYNYLFWSILATGTIAISINMFKKQQ